MPKRPKDKNTGIVVKFYEDTSDMEISDFLNNLEISGVRASNLINRWAVEVPFWKEESFVKKLTNSELVEKVYTNSFRKKKTYETQTEEEADDNE